MLQKVTLSLQNYLYLLFFVMMLFTYRANHLYGEENSSPAQQDTQTSHVSTKTPNTSINIDTSIFHPANALAANIAQSIPNTIHSLQSLETQTNPLRMKAFLEDYRSIRAAYPNDPKRRIETTIYREYILNIMETEFYLSLLLGSKSLQKTKDHIQRDNILTRSLQQQDFYSGARDFHTHLAQMLKKDHTDFVNIMIGILTKISIEYNLLEEKQEMIVQAILDASRAKHLNDPEIQNNKFITDLIEIKEEEFNTTEDVRLALLELMGLSFYAKDQLFNEAPWAMIIFEDIAHDSSNHYAPLKDYLASLYQGHFEQFSPHTSLQDLSVSNFSVEEIIERIRNLNGQAKHKVKEASMKALLKIPRQLNSLLSTYKNIPEDLLQHNLILNQVALYLEKKNLTDPKAVEYFQEIMAQPTASSPTQTTTNQLLNFFDDNITAKLAILGSACGLGSIIAKSPLGFALVSSLALLWTTYDPIKIQSIRNRFFNGTLFKFNSFYKYDTINSFAANRALYEGFAEVFHSVVLCSAGLTAGKTLINKGQKILHQRQRALRLPSNITFSPLSYLHPKKMAYSFGRKLRTRAMSLSLQNLAASAITLLYAQAQVNDQGLLEPYFYRSILTDPELLLTLTIFLSIDFLYVFRGVNSGNNIFNSLYRNNGLLDNRKTILNPEHFKAVKRVALDVTLLSLTVQSITHLSRSGSIKEVDLGRSFFEASFVALFALTKAKLVIKHIIAPIEKSTIAPSKKTSVIFSAFLLSNLLGNSLVSQTVDTFNQKIFDIIHDYNNQSIIANILPEFDETLEVSAPFLRPKILLPEFVRE